MEVGEHCGIAECRQLDFLPFKCPDCHKTFCSEHRLAVNHSCSQLGIKAQKNVVPTCPLCGQIVPVERGESKDRKVNDHIQAGCPKAPKKAQEEKAFKHKCNKNGCKKSEAVPVTCKSCGLNYCFTHRFESDHECRGAGKGSSDGKNKGGGSSASGNGNGKGGSAPPRRTKKQLRTKVILKQPAEGPSKVGESDRFSFPLYFPSNSVLPPKHVYCHKNWTVGKALDYFTDRYGIVNVNNQLPEEERLHLFSLKLRDVLPNDRTMASLVPDMLSKEGVVLEHGLRLRDDYVTSKDTKKDCCIQ